MLIASHLVIVVSYGSYLTKFTIIIIFFTVQPSAQTEHKENVQRPWLEQNSANKHPSWIDVWSDKDELINLWYIALFHYRTSVKLAKSRHKYTMPDYVWHYQHYCYEFLVSH